MPRSSNPAPLAVPGWGKIDEAPFDFQRRRVSVLVEREGRRLLITKGAPEDVIRCASRYEEPGKPELLPLDNSARIRATKLFDGLSADGFRALGVAWREMEPDRTAATAADERDLVFSGFIVFFDPPKASAQHAVSDFRQSGSSRPYTRLSFSLSRRELAGHRAGVG